MNTLTYKLVAIAALSVAFVGTASAATNWDASHPRRAEVNRRLVNQDHRIHQEVREGEMSHVQATRLHRDDHQIRREERLMASQDGGHITRQEDRALNQQENRVSRQIGQ
ncbi:hypothetical protein PPGU19_098540 (plasmid) [Paraburkholderia sp. PGU19]|uniref:hypothetical protein n=1 Tax=Paraburkholderia sp. PGU19 TaxID=2735434 RepID=UPI0015DA20DE|nr:hypothetical protein [Paraburkholderia sp. PGU19]BCG05286.1 hypothetical protein PPGU19_098540 [Paraburkholderia sp. PGU19]